MHDEWDRRDGAPSPLGATWVAEDQEYNFAIYSRDAKQVLLLLYSESDVETPFRTIPFVFPRNKTNRVWHVRVPGHMAAAARYYGLSHQRP